VTIGAADFGYIRDLVRQRSAIMLEEGKEYLVVSRLSALATQEGFASLEHFLSELRNKPMNRLHLKVVEAMTTNETTFFRDVHPFDLLQSAILPELIERKGARRQLSIWCAGCSTGQEPYTVAMIIREHFPSLLGWDLTILGTDLSGDVLERARAGLYTQLEINRGLPASYLVKYFRKEGIRWQVADEVRLMVEYRQINLCDSWSALPPMDLVFMRNVLIYFDVDTKQAILGRIRRVLRPNGYLILGGAETTLGLDDAYERLVVGRAVCYRPAGF